MKANENFGFADRVSTRICLEHPTPDNPYICQQQFLAGYNTLELVEKSSFTDVLLLLLRLEIPEPEHKRLLETLMIGLINPGPRHPATKAAMSASISKTNAEHILPASLSVMGGSRGGAAEVSESYIFIQNNADTPVAEVLPVANLEATQRFAPGFGRHFGGYDHFIHTLAEKLIAINGASKYLSFAVQLGEHLHAQSAGLLDVGLAAAVMCDLGLGARESAVLYQFIRAPGLLAHGLEQTHRPINAIPLLEDEHYVCKT